MSTKTNHDDPGLNEAQDTLEHALLEIHDIADVLYVMRQARDIVMPTNGLSYLAGALEDAYRKAQDAMEQVCYPKKEPQP